MIEVGQGDATAGVFDAEVPPLRRARRDSIEEVADIVAVEEEGGVGGAGDEGVPRVHESRRRVVVEQQRVPALHRQIHR